MAVHKSLVVRWVVAGITAMAGSGCVGYYAQSLRGQLEIMMRAEPIPKLVKDPATPATTRTRLEWIAGIRRFASEVLALPDNDAYTSFADLQRRYAVWVVFATPELSLEARQWCFPVAGCVRYRGYFTQHAAQAFARKLATQGNDVYVSGVPAYSTLGWFDDPVLSTVLHYSDEDLAGLIFHELAHQVVYVKDDTAFNESFATAVERIGVRRWLATLGDEERIQDYETRKYRRSRVIRLIELYRSRLQLVYARDQSAARKQARKRELLDELKAQYRALVKPWTGYRDFDAWFAKPINNAQLVSIATYYGLVPDFERLFDRLNGDLPAFYGVVADLARLPADQRASALAKAPRRDDQAACAGPSGHSKIAGRDALQMGWRESKS